VTYRKQTKTSEKTGKRGLRQDFVKQQASSLDQKTRQTTQHNTKTRQEKKKHTVGQGLGQILSLSTDPQKRKDLYQPRPQLHFNFLPGPGLGSRLLSF
jgi:hypothetical protein